MRGNWEKKKIETENWKKQKPLPPCGGGLRRGKVFTMEIEDELSLALQEVKSLLSISIGHLKTYAQSDPLKSEFDLLSKQARGVTTKADASAVREKYRSLIIAMDRERPVENGKKGSGFAAFFARDKKDKKEDGLEHLIALTDVFMTAFSKGMLLVVEDDDPLRDTLGAVKTGGYKKYSPSKAHKQGNKIVSFFMQKSLESEVVTREREELKNIISLLAGNIEKFGAETNTFDTHLSEYVQKIDSAATLEDIVAVKRAIVIETEVIRNRNSDIRKELSRAGEQINESNKKILELEKELEKARLEKTIDPLTKIYNRGALDDRLETSVRQVQAGRKIVCCIMYDVDDFKRINDTFGHRAGDQVLKAVASLSRETFGQNGFAGRYGGEEFVILIFERPLARCIKKAHQLLTTISDHQFVYHDKPVKITISIGVTMVRDGDTVESVYKRVDQLLYKAKSGGKNRVEVE